MPPNPVAHDKDTKVEHRSGPPRPATGTSSVPPRRSSMPPASLGRSSIPPASPGRSSIPPSKALGRDAFPGIKPIAPVQGSVPPLRAKLASIEEISSSLLLADDGTIDEKAAQAARLPPSTGPSFEELSGSMLLDDPDASGESPATAPDASWPRPAGRLAPDTERPTNAPDTVRPPAAPHRALLGMPELPTSTPPPDLSALPASIHPPPDLKQREGSVRPLAPPTEPFAFVPPARDTPSSLPTAIAWPSPIAASATGSEPVDSSQDPIAPDVEVTSLPRSSLRAARDSIREGLRDLRTMTNSPEKRPPWFIPLVAGIGLVLGIGVAAFLALAVRKPEDNDAHSTETASAAAATSARAHVPAAEKPMAPPAELGPCVVAGQPQVLAASATVTAGIEVRPLGSDVALGFAADDHRGSAVRVDPTSLVVTGSVDAPSGSVIRRVTPLLSIASPSGRGPLAPAIDADTIDDALQGRRTVPLPSPLELGASGGSLWWAHPGGPAAGKLWPIEGDGNVEALRGAGESVGDTTTTAIGVRRAGAVWLGTATGRSELAPRGGLSRIEGLGGGVGQPAVAISDGIVLAAWADRATATDPWRLRWVRFKAGEGPGAPGTFMPPAGGQGEQAMSPGVAAVPGGRFLLVWTEGPAARHDVRALTLSREGQPLGPPLVISNRGINAGQGQASVTAAQRGLVAFLESAGGGGFAVVATPISCAERAP